MNPRVNDMRLGIATCSENPEITPSDRLAAEAAARRLGAELIAVPWDLPPAASVDALVIRSTWGYYRDVAHFRRWLEGLRMPVLNPVPLMLGNLDKLYLLELETRGVPIVPSFVFREAAELEAGLRERGWDEVVLKPTVSAGSHLTFRAPAGEALPAGRRVLTHSPGIAQPFTREIVESGEISAVYHKARGAAPGLSHAFRKRPAPGDFRVQPGFGGVTRPHALSPAERKFCDLVLSRIAGEWLYARVDLVVTDQPRLCELELVEPNLFYELPGADPEGFAAALVSHLS